MSQEIALLRQLFAWYWIVVYRYTYVIFSAFPGWQCRGTWKIQSVECADEIITIAAYLIPMSFNWTRFIEPIFKLELILLIHGLSLLTL